MLSVSQDWLDMFDTHILDEALIKFVIEDYGTLYKTDIFSYEFKGYNHFLCDVYPSYSATIKAVMRSAYLNFSNFIRKKIDVYYGYKINGVDEYHKALPLIIDNIEVSDDGRIATFSLKSPLAYLTDTIQNLSLYQSKYNGTLDWRTSFWYFCEDKVFGNGNWIDDGNINQYIRFLPSKITKGNAVQSLAFTNCRYIKLQSDGKYLVGEEIKASNMGAINFLNVMKYPHYTKMEYPTSIVVDWLDVDNPFDYQIGSAGNMLNFETYTHSGTQQKYNEGYMDLDNQNVFILFNVLQYTAKDGNGYDAPYSNAFLDVYNDKVGFYYKVNAISPNAYLTNINVRGYNFSNRYEIVDEQVSIFDINIVDNDHANAIKSRVETYLSTQKEVELELRINPAIELLDKIYFDNDTKSVLVEEMSLSFNGAYKGRIKGRFDDSVLAPKVVINSYDNLGHYSITITNPNGYEVALHFKYSGSFYVDGGYISANASITITDSDIPELSNSFREKRQQSLQDELLCYFEAYEQNSDNVIILESD